MAESVRARQSYNLNELATRLREQAQTLGDDMDEALARFIASVEDDAQITADEVPDVLAALARAYKSATELASSLTVLDASGTEPALRVVQQQEMRQQKRGAS